MLYDFQQCLLTNECILACLYFSLYYFCYFYVRRRTNIHKWHVSFGLLHQKTLEESSKHLLLHLMKYFKVWIDNFIKDCWESCRVYLCVLDFVCLHPLKHTSLTYTAQWIFTYVSTSVTVTQIKMQNIPWASESSIVPLSCQKTCSSNCCSDVYYHGLVLPVLEPYIKGIIHLLCLPSFAQCFWDKSQLLHVSILHPLSLLCSIITMYKYINKSIFVYLFFYWWTFGFQFREIIMLL